MESKKRKVLGYVCGGEKKKEKKEKRKEKEMRYMCGG